MFGLLGPNGAGKSTTIKMLSTLARADSGTAVVAGIDVARHPARVRRAIGYVAQKSVADPMDTGVENLVLAGRIQGLTRTGCACPGGRPARPLPARRARRRQVKTYSGGMARKLDVAIGLMHRPAGPLPRRAHDGSRPGGARRALGRDRADDGAREHDGPPHHPLPGGGGPARQPARDRRPRRGRGRGHARGAEERAARRHRHRRTRRLRRPRAALAALERVDALREIGVDGRTRAGPRRPRCRYAPGGARRARDAASVPVASATVARPSLDDVYLRHTGRTLTAAQETAQAHELENAS